MKPMRPIWSTSWLVVSRSTVVAAYDELRARGLVESRRGSGTTVARSAGRGRSGTDKRMPAGYGASLFHRIAVGPGEVIAMTYAVDPGMPELVAEVADLARTELPALLMDVGYHPRGLQVLRERIADHFTESGLSTAPEEIVVTSGAHQAIALVTQMYLRTGAAVVIEQPSWPGCFDLFGAAGGRVVGVPLDDAGIRPDLLAAALAEHQPAMLFVMPTFHNPTGRLMSSARRRQVADLAAKYGVVVVEDNAYSAWDPSGPEIPPPLAAFAPPHAEVKVARRCGSGCPTRMPGCSRKWRSDMVSRWWRAGRWTRLASTTATSGCRSATRTR